MAGWCLPPHKPRTHAFGVAPKPPDDGVPAPPPGVAMSRSMAQFVEAYYRKYSRAMYQPNRSTIMWLSKLEHVSPDKANLTSFEGGTYLVPPAMAPVYFRHRAIDYRARFMLPVNERTVPGEQTATLALELDYRFQSLDKVPPDETFLEHIRVANAAVRRHIETELGTMRLMVFRCAPKPKLSKDRCSVAVGFHLIYNRAVSIADGAQVSHAVHLQLAALDESLREVVDNIYVKHKAYVKSASLRPPLASKKVDCYFCSDKAAPVDAMPDLDAERPAVACGMCQSHRFVLDTNVYTLSHVWTMDSEDDVAMMSTLSSDTEMMLRTASIWGLGAPVIRIRVPDNEPKYTLFEISEASMPARPAVVGTLEEKLLADKRDDLARRDAEGKRVKVCAHLVQFGMMGVKSRHDKGVEVPRDAPLIALVRAAIAEISPRYRECTIGKLLAYKNAQALMINVNGPGSKYCMAQEGEHTSNRACLWLVDDSAGDPRVYAGCYSMRCGARYKKIENVTPSLITSAVAHVKRRLGEPENLLGDLLKKKKKKAVQ